MKLGAQKRRNPHLEYGGIMKISALTVASKRQKKQSLTGFPETKQIT